MEIKSLPKVRRVSYFAHPDHRYTIFLDYNTLTEKRAIAMARKIARAGANSFIYWTPSTYGDMRVYLVYTDNIHWRRVTEKKHR